MDASEPAARLTARLTEREKEVLRAWLEHKSAKEIAIDLGITHHAVEKRLKMARTKLGVATSLEAARMLAGAEGYGQAVTGAAALSLSSRPRPMQRYRPVILGGIAMSFAIILALALAPSPETAPDTSPPAAPAIRLDSNMAPIFDKLDEDASGYLEQPESPFVTMAITDPAQPDAPDTASRLPPAVDPEPVAQFYAAADTDGDARVSFREFHVWNTARLAELGVDTSMALTLRPLPES